MRNRIRDAEGLRRYIDPTPDEEAAIVAMDVRLDEHDVRQTRGCELHGIANMPRLTARARRSTRGCR